MKIVRSSLRMMVFSVSFFQTLARAFSTRYYQKNEKHPTVNRDVELFFSDFQELLRKKVFSEYFFGTINSRKITAVLRIQLCLDISSKYSVDYTYFNLTISLNLINLPVFTRSV